MSIRSRSLIEKEVDRLFDEIKAKARDGDNCEIPVVGGGFIWGLDPVAPLKEATRGELFAHEWFAEYGPADAPPFPYQHEIDSYRDARGLKGVVGFYARSLRGQDFDVRKHPPFDDFARGLMAFALEYGLWNLEKDDSLIKRFPPLPLPGMTPSAYWAPPKEYEEIMASYYKEQRRAA
jgi:hypothetical protein